MAAISEILARELGCAQAYVENIITLLDEGNTIPFIARYRKEQHGSMDDTTLRKLEDRLTYLRSLDQRRQEVKKAVDGQGKLTPELSAAIDAAATLAEVEDLYRPYKQKRRTRATAAREKGLEPLAQLLYAQERTCPRPEDAAADFIIPENGVETIVDALQGANDIVAELLSDDAAIRKTLRGLLMRQGHLRSLAAKEEDSVYRLYYDFDQSVAKLADHQILAINRGEKEGFLSVTVLLDRDAALPVLRRAAVKPGSAAMEFMKSACEDAYDRLIYPSLEREVRGALTERAAEGAIANFALNLKPLLMQPPVKGHVTMGLDPGYAHGCKVAVIDGTGKVLDTTVVYPTYGERQKKEAITRLSALIRKHRVEHLAIGNGTASRETEQMAVEMIRALGGGVSYMMVNEAGASVYSASQLAAEEFPDYDVNLRSAVSIARRLQDPLAELVKIDPKAIGVGQYQHDCPQKRLDETLSGVVEDCVNAVGVDVNTAVMDGALAAISAAGGMGVPTVKPWDRDTVFAKLEQVRKADPVAIAMDIDAAGLPFLQNLTPPAGSKTVPELREIIDYAKKPFIIKGIMTVKGARKALEAGASGIVVSNHGGRVLDQCPATAEVLPAIADAVGGQMKIFVDGGIRTGLDVLKALALGADGVLIGRPFVTMVYGGAAEGVDAYVRKLTAELRDGMAMCGVHSLDEITREIVFRP